MEDEGRCEKAVPDEKQREKTGQVESLIRTGSGPKKFVFENGARKTKRTTKRFRLITSTLTRCARHSFVCASV